MTTVPYVASRPRLVDRPLEQGRGRWGMAMFIVTEAALFSELFFSYFFLGTSHRTWPPEQPKVLLAGIMTAILVASSVVLFLGDRAMKRGNTGTARTALGITILMGIGFLVAQGFEYRDHLKTLRPSSSSYGSIFYTTTSFHAAHVFIGLLLLAFAFAQLLRGHIDRRHHLPYTNVSWYWHFVDTVWVIIYAVFYIAPRIYQ